MHSSTQFFLFADKTRKQEDRTATPSAKQPFPRANTLSTSAMLQQAHVTIPASLSSGTSFSST
jgi:hypothetical protein